MQRQNRSSADTMFLSVDGDAEDSPWTSSYEVATVNQYSTDVEESLKAYKSAAHTKLSVSVLYNLMFSCKND